MATSKFDANEYAVGALVGSLGKSNSDAVDIYFSREYIQDSLPEVANGSNLLKDLIVNLGDRGCLETDADRVIRNSDLLTFHGEYECFKSKTMIFEVFRVEDVRIAGHCNDAVSMPRPDAKHNEAGKC